MSWDDDLIEGQEIGALEDQSAGSDGDRGIKPPNQDQIQQFNASKFYYNFDKNIETAEGQYNEDLDPNGIDELKLEQISYDENQSDNTNLLEDDNRELSKKHADEIKE